MSFVGCHGAQLSDGIAQVRTSYSQVDLIQPPLSGRDLDEATKQTSFIFRVFGGTLMNSVTCSVCHTVSKKEDPFLNLSLDVRQASSLRVALEHFTRPERLTGNNRFHCDTCVPDLFRFFSHRLLFISYRLQLNYTADTAGARRRWMRPNAS